MKRIIIATLFLCFFIGINAQNISRSQAIADIDTLLYTLTEVHPNLYDKISRSDLNDKIVNLKAGLQGLCQREESSLIEFSSAAEARLCQGSCQRAESSSHEFSSAAEARLCQDSIYAIELYGLIAPIVAQIGDAHTTMVLPYRDVMLKVGKYIPVYPTIDNNTGKIYVKASVGNLVPYDSEIVSINDVSAKEMKDRMLMFVGGEREFFRLSMIDNNIMGLFHYLFAAQEYAITYIEPGSKEKKSITLKPVEANKLNSELVLSPKIMRLMSEHGSGEPYSFRIIDDKPVAVMNFDACQDVNGMKAFADSMFTELRKRDIKHLIIDMRYNGGGNSAVGDVLLSYIAPKPFAQYGKTLIKVKPTTIALTGNRYEKPGTLLYPEDPDSRHEPLPIAQRFAGNVFLLTSHTTFSSASSFAWAFKEAGCGMIIGEETGGMSVHYGDVVSFKLPNSGLVINVSHKRFWLPGADENDIHGVLPDILCPQEHALETAIDCIDN
ncbi:MAG: hypothetical protein KBS65_01680 [Prevotella sp.]|nr:hypothetical protein [Candidatus Equicola stercoris]